MEFLFKMTVYFLWINAIVKLFRMNYIWGIWTKLKSSHERIVLHIPFSRIDIPNITQIEAFHRDTWMFNEKITDFDPRTTPKIIPTMIKKRFFIIWVFGKVYGLGENIRFRSENILPENIRPRIFFVIRMVFFISYDSLILIELKL